MTKHIINNTQDVIHSIATDIKGLKASMAELQAKSTQPSSPTTPETPPSKSMEIRGKGMPNGVVTADVGTIYLDESVTAGAMLWIKRSGNGNTGWNILQGDTGWIDISNELNYASARFHLRRINNLVYIGFGGLQYAWYGIKDMSQIQRGQIERRDEFGKVFTTIKMTTDKTGRQVLPEGFVPARSATTNISTDAGESLGYIYFGNRDDGKTVQFRLIGAESELNNTKLKQIRYVPIAWITDDPWPTPTI